MDGKEADTSLPHAHSSFSEHLKQQQHISPVAWKHLVF